MGNMFGNVDRAFDVTSLNPLTDYTGVMRTVMEYADSDDGMLVVTVCETDGTDYTGDCTYGIMVHSIQLELIPNAYPEIVICDETDVNCLIALLDNRFAKSGVYVLQAIWRLEANLEIYFKTFEKKREQFSSTEQTCDEVKLYTR